MRRFCFVLVCGICLGPVLASPASAQWFGKKPSKQPPPNPAASHQGFAGYIRRLMADARAAAARGDLATARSLAERAHKVAITGKPMLTNEPDCTPEATAALVQQFRAKPEPVASPVVVAQSAPQKTIDLAPLLDANAQETTLPLPPSPAPEIDAPQRRTAIAARPVAKRLENAAAESAVVQDEPASHPSSRITSVVNQTRKRSAKSSRSEHTAGFLALQTDWLSPEANSAEVIKDLAEQPVRADTKTPRQRTASTSERPAADDVDEPEVTTAIGRGVNRWQLDVEQDSTKVKDDSAPQLSQDMTQSHDLPQTDPAETALGVWSAAAAQDGAGASGQQVVSLSDFLDPNGNRPATQQLAEAPRMIETDFRQPATPLAAATTDSTSTTSPVGPGIQVHEGPALEWLGSAASASKTRPSSTKSSSAELDWSRWSPARKAAVIAMALLLAGFALFGLSLRWT